MYPNLITWRNKLIYISDELRVRTFSFLIFVFLIFGRTYNLKASAQPIMSFEENKRRCFEERWGGEQNWTPLTFIVWVKTNTEVFLKYLLKISFEGEWMTVRLGSQRPRFYSSVWLIQTKSTNISAFPPRFVTSLCVHGIYITSKQNTSSSKTWF